MLLQMICFRGEPTDVNYSRVGYLNWKRAMEINAYSKEASTSPLVVSLIDASYYYLNLFSFVLIV